MVVQYADDEIVTVRLLLAAGTEQQTKVPLDWLAAALETAAPDHDVAYAPDDGAAPVPVIREQPDGLCYLLRTGPPWTECIPIAVARLRWLCMPLAVWRSAGSPIAASHNANWRHANFLR